MSIISKNCVFAIALFLVLSLSFATDALANPKRDQLEKTMAQTIRVDAKAGKALAKWHAEQDQLIEDFRNAKVEVQWLELQEKKYNHYVASNQRKIDLLEETNTHYAVIELQLEGAMWDYFDSLKLFVENDLPFLREERTARLQFLENTVDNPDISLGEKFRRFSEALNVEAAYGTDVTIGFQTALFENKSTDLVIIRTGRIGFFALTLDGKQSGIWDAKRASFTQSTEDQHEYITTLHDKVNNKQIFQLISLPVGSASHENL